MFCSRCRKEIKDKSKFCTHCGAMVGLNMSYDVDSAANGIEDASTIEQQNLNNKNGFEEDSENLKPLIIGLIIMVFILILSIAVCFLVIRKLDLESEYAFVNKKITVENIL